jgi:hypothetical protein
MSGDNAALVAGSGSLKVARMEYLVGIVTFVLKMRSRNERR